MQCEGSCVDLNICLFIYLFIYISIYLSIYRFIYMCIYLFIYMYLSIYWSIYLCIWRFIYLSYLPPSIYFYLSPCCNHQYAPHTCSEFSFCATYAWEFHLNAILNTDLHCDLGNRCNKTRPWLNTFTSQWIATNHAELKLVLYYAPVT